MCAFTRDYTVDTVNDSKLTYLLLQSIDFCVLAAYTKKSYFANKSVLISVQCCPRRYVVSRDFSSICMTIYILRNRWIKYKSKVAVEICQHRRICYTHARCQNSIRNVHFALLLTSFEMLLNLWHGVFLYCVQ